MASSTGESGRRAASSRHTAKVALIRTENRADGVYEALRLLGANPVRGKTVFLKPNFNSADPAPGSTDAATLKALVGALWDMDATAITLGDRSGMGNTRRVMEDKGVFELGAQLGFDTIVFDELPRDDWEMVTLPGSYWANGFALPKPVLRAAAVVQTCCLKTHRFGGHFTLSLKNSVGLVAKYVPDVSYNYMVELHRSPHQRTMIADINAAYKADLILMDGVEAFVNGGPDRGGLARPGVVLASQDRVAIDAVGVAILRHLGTTPEVSAGRVFDQEQIARAVELGIGVKSPAQIEILTAEPQAAAYAATIRQILTGGA